MEGKPPAYVLRKDLYDKILEDQILFWRTGVNQWLDFCKNSKQKREKDKKGGDIFTVPGLKNPPRKEQASM